MSSPLPTPSPSSHPSVHALCTSSRKGEPKTPVSSAVLVANHGIEGDVHAGQWHRQVSLLALEDIDNMRRKGLPDLKDGDFGENIVLSGLDLSGLGLGSVIRIGDTVELSITQIGKVCHSRCAIYDKTGDCIMPRLGLFARVTVGGRASTGDRATIDRTVDREVHQCVVLTVSDRCSRGETDDTAGPSVARLLKKELSAHVYCTEIVPDERQQIEAKLKHYCDGHGINLVLAVGGTGFAPRDATPEAVASIIERPTPGLDEAMRAESMKKTPHAMLSRAVSGIRGSTLAISLPGSERAATENLAAVLPALDHGLRKLRGDAEDCGRPTHEHLTRN